MSQVEETIDEAEATEGLGGLFGEEAAAAAVASTPCDATFELDCQALLAEGTPLPPLPSALALALPKLRLFAAPPAQQPHSLWGDRLWNAGRYIARALLLRRFGLQPHGAAVLELGAGLGVPGLIAATAACGARCVVLTDHPDPVLMGRLRRNVEINRVANGDGDGNGDLAPIGRCRVEVEALLWGDAGHIHAVRAHNGGSGFDLVLLSDLVFNHVCHTALLRTVAACLQRDPRARAVCAFSHHRPAKAAEDLALFERCAEFGLRAEKVDADDGYALMFPDDPGPCDVRRTVHCYLLSHVFDDAGPPIDLSEVSGGGGGGKERPFDVVLQGTGLVETFLSAALARAGLRVLHVDKAAHYGGAFVSLGLRQLASHLRAHACDDFAEAVPLPNADAEATEVHPLLTATALRQYSIDLMPLSMLKGGDTVGCLVDSDVARHLQFQHVDRLLLLLPPTPSPPCSVEASEPWRVVRVPLTRSDVFQSALLAPLETRRMMRLCKDVEASLAEREHAAATATPAAAAASGVSLESAALPGELFPAFLRRRYQLSDQTVALLTLHGLLQAPNTASDDDNDDDNDDNDDDGESKPGGGSSVAVRRSAALLRTYLVSTPRFGGSTPFLSPVYGSGELPQALCRVGAVWDALFILRRGVHSVDALDSGAEAENATTASSDGVLKVRLSNGQVVPAKAVVVAKESLPHCSDRVRFARVVVVATRPLVGWRQLVALGGSASASDTVTAATEEGDDGDGDDDDRVRCIPSLLLAASVGGSDEAAAAAAVRIYQGGADVKFAPPGACVVHFVADAAVVPVAGLNALVDGLTSTAAAASISVAGKSGVVRVALRGVLYRCCFTLDAARIARDSSGNSDAGPLPSRCVFPVGTLFRGLDDGRYVREARRAFARVVRHCRAVDRNAWCAAPFPGSEIAAAAAATAEAAEPIPQFLERLPDPPGASEYGADAATDDNDDDDARLLGIR